MNRRLLCIALSFCSAGLVFAGSSTNENAATASTEEAGGGFPFEIEAEYGYFGESEVSRGRLPNLRDVDDLDEDYAYAKFIYTPRIKFGILRLGAVYERFGFGGNELFEVPRGLQSLAAVVGLDTKFSDAILVRLEMQPGLYSSKHLDGDDYHIPIVFGGTYIYSDTLQFVLGVSIDYERDYPVFPGGGVRWRMGAQLLLNAVLPTPRLEYELTKDFTLYAGADLKGSTFRVDDRFGTEHGGDTRLNHAVVTYTEVRTGLGFEWKMAPEIKFSLEGGYLPYRNIDFYRADVRYHHEEGAPYVSASVRAAF